MTALTSIITRLFDLLVVPFGAHRTVGLIALSLLTGAGLTLLYRATADEKRIRRTREVFKARVLEMRLYPDDVVLITRAMLGAIAAQGAYLRAAAIPILLVALIAVPVFLQIEARYAHAPLGPGDRTLVTARLKQGLDVRDVPTHLAVAPASAEGGVRVDPESVRAQADREVTWRVDVTAAGRHEAELKAYDLAYQFPISAQPDGRAIGTQRRTHSFTGAIVDIGLPEIGPDSPIEAVRVTYPDASYRVFGMRMSWLLTFALASLVGAMIPAVLLKVAL